MRWDAKGVRAHFLERAARCGVGTAEKLVTSLRAFLRYLSVHGRCRADLDKAVPAFASWRLADLPKYLTTEQVDRLIAACDGGSRNVDAIARSSCSWRDSGCGPAT